MIGIPQRVSKLTPNQRELLAVRLKGRVNLPPRGGPLGTAKRLVAYVVLDREPGPNISELRRFLQQQLPEYMVPSTLVLLDTIPLTPNGKVDRRALPATDHSRPDLENSFVDPRTPMESLIAEIWQELLDVDRVGVNDNFFDLGGHSLLAMRVVARLENKLGLRINPLELIYQTLGQLASTCEKRMHVPHPSKSPSFVHKLWSVMKNAGIREADNRK